MFLETVHALNLHLQEYSIVSPVTVVYVENIEAERDLCLPYMIGYFIPADSVLETIAYGMKHVGIYQIDVYVPVDEGYNKLLTICDGVFNYYKGEVLTNNGFSVYINAISMVHLGREDSWFRSSVSVNFEVHS